MLELGRVQPGLVFLSRIRKSRQNSPKDKRHQVVRMAAFMDVLLNTKDDNAEMIWCLFTLNEGILCFA